MHHHKLCPRQLWAWITAAVSAPLAHYSGAGWFAVLLAAGAMLPLTLLSSEGWRSLSKVEAALEFAWIIMVLAALIPGSGAYWSGAQTQWVVPLTMLALAALSGSGERAARVGATLFWILILMYLPLIFAGVVRMKFEYLTPIAGEWTAGLLLTLLIPGLAGVWKEDGHGACLWTLGIGVLAAALAVMSQGILSGAVAMTEEAPFFELSRNLGRFEPLVAAALTFGWYQFASFLMNAAAMLGTKFGLNEKWGRRIVFGGAAFLVLYGVQMDGIILTILGLSFWVLVPMLHTKKLSKKSEKRC